MSTAIDTGILELMASKVCHDLISPIGAVNNGIEFLTEMGPDAGEEVTDLIAFSASQASAKLKAYRMAYGAGGADDSIKPEEVHQAIEDIVGAEKKIVQEWDPYGPLGYEDRPKAFCKMLICALLLGMDCLPKGGILKVEAGESNGSTLLIASGQDAGIREQTAQALDLSMSREMLGPKYVHPYITGLLAQSYGYKITILKHEGSVHIVLTLPDA
ncbi:MAG: hypothetical protein KDI11_05755 [Alphaproteobacteria bacterium]|nr:hypothetical protein [Alphaproteobacteria bacterium]